MYIAAIDLGYGDTKIMSSNNDNIVIPSVVGPGHDRSMAGIMGAEQNGLEHLHVKVDGREYFVGELAQKESKSTITLESNKIYHQNTKILLATAAGLVMPPGLLGVHLSTGLPYSDYASQMDEFYNYLKYFRADVEFITGPAVGERKTIKFNEITLFPQAVAAIQPALRSEDLKNIENTNELISVIDVGEKTTDVVTFEAKKRFSLRAELSATFDAGISDLYSTIMAHYLKHTGKRLDAVLAKVILKQMTTRYSGNTLDFKDVITKAKVNLANNIIDRVKLLWGNKGDSLMKVYLVGGGSLVLDSAIMNVHKTSQKVENPQMANANGYLEIAKARSRKLAVVG